MKKTCSSEHAFKSRCEALGLHDDGFHIYAQIIDDTAGRTLCSAGTVEKDIAKELEKTGNKAAAEYLGKVIAERALEKGIKTVVFDRGGYVYKGKVAALADAARKAGLEF